LKTQTKIQAQEWTQATNQMPAVGKKILAFVWRDKTVCQAWWNGEHYLLVTTDEQYLVQVYQVPLTAVSHWRDMPEVPEISTNVHELVEHRLNGTMH
jgi:hypothetical protein